MTVRKSISVVFALLASALHAQTPGELENGFLTPPREARPQTLWFWMNGNVTRDGITRDLEAMARVGIGGALMFDGSTYVPEGPAKYLSPEWRGLMTHAIKEADRLGLTLGMHNAPGWSSSGGPWITPGRAMQQLVWTETTVQGGRAVDVALAQPQTNLGFYRDAFVLAFPALAAETTAYEEALRSITTANGTAVPKAARPRITYVPARNERPKLLIRRPDRLPGSARIIMRLSAARPAWPRAPRLLSRFSHGHNRYAFPRS